MPLRSRPYASWQNRNFTTTSTKYVLLLLLLLLLLLIATLTNNNQIIAVGHCKRSFIVF